jgi:hypothetical protein
MKMRRFRFPPLVFHFSYAAARLVSVPEILRQARPHEQAHRTSTSYRKKKYIKEHFVFLEKSISFKLTKIIEKVINFIFK